MKTLYYVLIFIAVIISLFILYLLFDSLPEYIKNEKQNTTGDEVGLTSMIVTFLIPILFFVDIVLWILIFKVKKWWCSTCVDFFYSSAL
jgi:isoprenylcysteine carboxyl methyltransferase (ICMT) family protein YpbQ